MCMGTIPTESDFLVNFSWNSQLVLLVLVLRKSNLMEEIYVTIKSTYCVS